MDNENKKYIQKKDAGIYLIRIASDIPRYVKQWGVLITIGYLMGILQREGSRLYCEQDKIEKEEKRNVESGK